MKNIYFVLLISLSLLSCKKNKLEAAVPIEESVVDTVDEKYVSYSIREQNKVIADIYFGDNKKSVEKSLEIFVKQSAKKLNGSPSNSYLIGNYKFDGISIPQFYSEDKLYRLNILGNPISYKNYDSELRPQADFLKDVIVQKYGSPNVSIPIPELIEVEDQYTYLIHKWIIGQKTIEIRLTQSGVYNYINLEIFLPGYEKVLDEKRNEENKNNTKEAVKVF